MKRLLLLLAITLSSTFLVSMVYGAGGDELIEEEIIAQPERFVESFIYDLTSAHVTYSDGTTQIVTVEEVGCQEYLTFTKNLTRPPGTVPIITPNNILVIRSRIPSAVLTEPDTIIDTKIEGVVPATGLSNVTAESTVK